MHLGALLALCLCAAADALLPSQAAALSTQVRGAPAAPRPVARLGRREALTAAALLTGVASPALASGGATAGKTTSIPRAKLRYYQRITEAVAAFERVGAGAAAGSAAAAKGFFATNGPYDELKGAGFLLAVAFKIDTKIPPDKIPTVRMHK